MKDVNRYCLRCHQPFEIIPCGYTARYCPGCRYQHEREINKAKCKKWHREHSHRKAERQGAV